MTWLVLIFALSSDPSGVYTDDAKQYGIVVARAGDHHRVEWWTAGETLTYLGTLERVGPWTYTERWFFVEDHPCTVIGWNAWTFDWAEGAWSCYGRKLLRVP